MKRLLLKKGFGRIDNGHSPAPNEYDVNRLILDDLVARGILSTEDCCTYTLTASTDPTCAQLSENHAKTYYVDPNGDYHTQLPGSTHCPYQTIQGAVNAAVAASGVGETIKILPGTYVLNEAVDYSGFSSGTFDISAGVRIISGGNGHCFSCANGGANGVTFTGLGSIQAVSASKACIHAGISTHLTVRNITLRNLNGRVIDGAFPNLYISNCLIQSGGDLDCITSSNGAAYVTCVNTVSNYQADSALDWRIQPLYVDPLFATS